MRLHNSLWKRALTLPTFCRVKNKGIIDNNNLLNVISSCIFCEHPEGWPFPPDYCCGSQEFSGKSEAAAPWILLAILQLSTVWFPCASYLSDGATLPSASTMSILGQRLILFCVPPANSTMGLLSMAEDQGTNYYKQYYCQYELHIQNSWIALSTLQTSLPKPELWPLSCIPVLKTILLDYRGCF